MRTTDRAYTRWLEIAAHVLREPTTTLPTDLIAEEIGQTFDCSGVAHNWPDGSATRGLRIWPSSFRSMVEQATAATFALNPLFNYYRITGDPSPRSITALPSSVAGPRELAAWREFSEPWQVYQQMALPLAADAPPPRAYYVIGRPAGPFGREELAVARALQPVLSAVDRQSAVLRRLPSQPPAGKAGDSTGNDRLLTSRELAVLTLLAEGRTAASIGRQLGITPRTAAKHLERIYTKLEVNNRVTAVAVAQRAGILPAPVGVRE